MKIYLQISLLFFIVCSVFIGCSNENDAFSTTFVEECPPLSIGNTEESHLYGIDSIYVTSNCMNFDVAFSGGCQEHTFNLWWNEEYETELFDNRKTVKAVLYLVHHNNGDYCEALVRADYSFDINQLRHADFSEVAIEIFSIDSSYVYQYRY